MYKRFVSPVLDKLDSEKTHVWTRELLHLAECSPATLKLLELLAYKHRRFFDPRLSTQIDGIKFENPLLVGAGWDKVGRAVRALWQLGFAGVEVGSVLEYLQVGNPKPRQFMIAPGVCLNRLGFNGPGMEEVFRNVVRYALSSHLNNNAVLGLSVGKNKDVPDDKAPEAHAVVVKKFYHFVSYFVINVSSPNTSGLRALQDKAPLNDIVQAVNQAMDEMGGRKPLFVKIAPELTNEAVDDVVEVVVDNGLTGIGATNTTVNDGIKARYGEQWRNEPGGLSGDDADFRKMSTQMISYIYKSAGDKLKIIGIGGIKDTATALEKIMAGATVLELVTAIRGEGPAVAGKINRGIVEFMDKRGVHSLNDLVGVGTL